jgi:Uma2 family endonuclease
MATTLAEQRAPVYLHRAGFLPESDGRPMSETDYHRKLMIALLNALEEYFRNDPQVYVTGNIFVYYFDENGVLQSISPDIFVVRGVEKKDRRIYKIDEEGKAPDFVIELISWNTKGDDLVHKRTTYAMMGVREYYLFDPLGEIIKPRFRGHRLEGNTYVPMVGTRLYSEVLGLILALEQKTLRIYDPKTNERLRAHKEAEADRRRAEAKTRTAEAKARAAEAKAQAAEAENVRLREELARLKKSSTTQ